jgi:hypothetical protein
MSFDPLSAAFDLGKSAIERIWPDPIKQAEEIRNLEALKQSGNLAKLDAHVKIILAQLNINANEAKHKSVFVAGWRPFIGWTGGAAMAYQFILYPILLWVIAFAYPEVTAPPVLETGALFSIVTGMLGVGAMRSFDKKNGTQTDNIN